MFRPFCTSTLDEGEMLTSCHGNFTPGRKAVPTEQQAGWVPEHVWTFGEERTLGPAGIRTQDGPGRRLLTTVTRLCCKYEHNLKGFRRYTMRYNSDFDFCLLGFYCTETFRKLGLFSSSGGKRWEEGS